VIAAKISGRKIKIRSIPMYIRLAVVLFASLLSGGVAAESAAQPENANQRRDTYVLVHGAWGGGWAWREVDKLLSAGGQKVWRPTLTGLGERAHLATPDIGLDTHIRDIVNLLLYENLHEVILVGHSYGGMVITGVADRVPERIRRLVYVDALLPESGESVTDMESSPLPYHRVKDWVENDLIVPPWLISGQKPPADVPQPLKTFTDPLLLTNPAARRIPATYILTVDSKLRKKDDFLPFAARAKLRGLKVMEMQADHNPQRTAPKTLTELLQIQP
jgi:pimeloyl-ACP methyl ester carboxylesterase